MTALLHKALAALHKRHNITPDYTLLEAYNLHYVASLAKSIIQPYYDGYQGVFHSGRWTLKFGRNLKEICFGAYKLKSSLVGVKAPQQLRDMVE